MDDLDLNLSAGLAAFLDDDGLLTEAIDGFAPLHDSDDCLRLLVATEISLNRHGYEIVADGGFSQHGEPVRDGDVLAAARRAAVSLAASWIHDDDLTRYRQGAK
ncbi:hypothetical protein LJR296_008176 [Cupriavidus necator]|uniref:hypothetical protein n=1 Tax=Cupriavidus necator TaxID=106590 RepID=UPI003ECFCEF2